MLKLHSLSSPVTAQSPHKSPSQFLSSQLSSRGRVFSNSGGVACVGLFVYGSPNQHSLNLSDCNNRWSHVVIYGTISRQAEWDNDEGKVRKVLKVEPLPDGSGHFFNLSVQNKLINLDESIYIPITRAEFAVLKSAFNFILPYILGWHAYANSIKPEDSGRANNSGIKYGGDFEWSR
ncbi:unnamed protein product [Malus baccata var. baccata]